MPANYGIDFGNRSERAGVVSQEGLQLLDLRGDGLGRSVKRIEVGLLAGNSKAPRGAFHFAQPCRKFPQLFQNLTGVSHRTGGLPELLPGPP